MMPPEQTNAANAIGGVLRCLRVLYLSGEVLFIIRVPSRCGKIDRVSC